MIYRPDGKKIAPRVGFIHAFDEVRNEGTTPLVATMYTYQDWEPLEMMKGESDDSGIGRNRADKVGTQGPPYAA